MPKDYCFIGVMLPEVQLCDCYEYYISVDMIIVISQLRQKNLNPFFFFYAKPYVFCH